MKNGFFAGLALGALIGAIILEAKPETMSLIKSCKRFKQQNEQNIQQNSECKNKQESGDQLQQHSC